MTRELVLPAQTPAAATQHLHPQVKQYFLWVGTYTRIYTFERKILFAMLVSPFFLLDAPASVVKLSPISCGGQWNPLKAKRNN